MSIHEDENNRTFYIKRRRHRGRHRCHIGLYTIIASKHVGLKGKVVAIEAEPGN